MRKQFLVVFAIAILLCGCYQRGTVKQTDFFEPYRIADANIPFADNLHTTQFDRVEEIETDSYGRRYFSYKTYSVMLASNVEIHLICQMTQGDEVFYYPDYCYIIRTEDDAAFTEAEISCLQACNDWNLPLIEDKMYATSRSQQHKDLANEKEIHAAINSYLDIDDSYGVLHNGLETMRENEQLFFVMVYPKGKDDKVNDAVQFYIMTYRSGSPQPIIMCEQVSNSLSCQEQIRHFRDTCLRDVYVEQ